MHSQSEPFVSVLTPVYNGAEFLEECIESVLAQTYTNFEYIIVNNCSTDRTLEIARSYAVKDPRIRVHDNTDFLGVIDNHNHAFRMVSPDAKYCKVVSGDDYIFPECIAELVRCAEANPSTGIIGCYQLAAGYIRWQGFQYPKSVFSGTELCRRLFLGEQKFLDGRPIVGFGSPTSLLYRCDLIRKSAAFYPNASPHSDTSACFEHLAECDFGFVYQVLSYERTHTGTQSYRSVQMNRYLSAGLNDLNKYGRLYLDGSEWRRCVRAIVKDYYEFLFTNYVTGVKEKEFWEYHKARLEELGFPYRRSAILRAGLATVGRHIMNPAQTITKLRRRFNHQTQGYPV